jgi:hypothetical protein
MLRIRRITRWVRIKLCIIRKIIRITFLLRIRINRFRVKLVLINRQIIPTIKIQAIVVVIIKFRLRLSKIMLRMQLIRMLRIIIVVQIILNNKRQEMDPKLILMGKLITPIAVMFIKIDHLVRDTLIQISLSK